MVLDSIQVNSPGVEIQATKKIFKAKTYNRSKLLANFKLFFLRRAYYFLRNTKLRSYKQVSWKIRARTEIDILVDPTRPFPGWRYKVIVSDTIYEINPD